MAERSRRKNAAVPAERFTPEQHSQKSRKKTNRVPEEPAYSPEMMNSKNDTSIRSISSVSLDEPPRGRARGRGRRLVDEMPASVGKKIYRDPEPSTSSGRASQYNRRTREPSPMVGRNERSKDSSVDDSSDEEVHDKDDDAFDEDKEDYMKEVSANENGKNKRKRRDEQSPAKNLRPTHHSSPIQPRQQATSNQSGSSRQQLLPSSQEKESQEEKNNRLLATIASNSQETLRRTEYLLLKLNTLTDLVSKLKIEGDDQSQPSNIVDQFIDVLPLDSLEEIDAFERRVKRKIESKDVTSSQLEHRLALIGGATEGKLVKNIMDFSITISLGRMYCWSGRQKKGDRIELRPFMKTELCKIIKGAVRKGFQTKSITDEFLKTKISNYLDGCKDSRKKIKQKRNDDDDDYATM